jgi:hypothetical protein
MATELYKLNREIAQKYEGNYTVIHNNGKYKLFDDDFEFNIPLVISENMSDIQDYLEGLNDD